MAIDPLLNAGYLPRSSEYRAAVSGDDTNNNLQLTDGNATRTLTITIPAPVRIDLAQLDLKVVSSTVNAILIYRVKINNVDVLIGSSRSDPTLVPITLYAGPIGTIFTAMQGDLIRLQVEGVTGAGAQVTIAGGLSLFGTFI